jgi:hypothetical protein
MSLKLFNRVIVKKTLHQNVKINKHTFMLMRYKINSLA